VWHREEPAIEWSSVPAILTPTESVPPTATDDVPPNLTPAMVREMGATVVILTMGDGTFREYAPASPLPLSDTRTACVVNISGDGKVLRTNTLETERCIQSFAQRATIDAASPFIVVQVPFKGGRKSWRTDQGKTAAEEAVLPLVVATAPLVSLFARDDWLDDKHPRKKALDALLVEVCDFPAVANRLRESTSGVFGDSDVFPVIAVMSDGWNREFKSPLDTSRYWRCRYDLSACRTFSDFVAWAGAYASSRPRNSGTLGMIEVLRGAKESETPTEQVL